MMTTALGSTAISDLGSAPGGKFVFIPKTNAVRLLEHQGIAFELRAYVVDPDDLAAESVALKVGLPPEQVFKTLVARGDETSGASAWPSCRATVSWT